MERTIFQSENYWYILVYFFGIYYLVFFSLKTLKFEYIYSNKIDEISLVTNIMKYEDAANIDEFAGKILHNIGRSDPPTVSTLPP